MVRHYAVTLAPILFRLSLPLAIAGGLAPSPAQLATLLWCSWVAPLLACETVRRLAGLWRATRVPLPGAVPLAGAR